MDTVDHVGCDIHRALETEGHIRAPQIVVNGLGQGDDIQPFLPQTVRRLVGTVAA